MNRITSHILRHGGGQLRHWNFSNVEKITQKFFQPSVYSNNIIIRSYSDQSLKYDPVSNLPLNDEKKGKLIYSGMLTRPVKGAKIFSLSTSMIGLGMLPFIVFSMEEAKYSKIVTAAMFSGFIIITPLLMHYVTKKYIISIYYNEETKIFTATSFSLFVRKKDHVFTAEDVDINPGAFSSIKVKGFPLLLDESRFIDKSYVSQILSLDKPITDFIKKDEE